MQNGLAIGYKVQTVGKKARGKRKIVTKRAKWMQQAYFHARSRGLVETQEQLATALGWHATTISGYFNATPRDDVPAYAMWAMHGFTGFDLPDEILDGDNDSLERADE